MPIRDRTISVIRCLRCDRTGHLTLQDDRFWCGWCQDWAKIVVQQVENAVLTQQQGRPVIKPKSTEWQPLQPLRIPAGWTVEYNYGLYEIDPPGEEVPAAELRYVFKEDMLILAHRRLNRVIDLGWYPEGDMESGVYHLRVYEGDYSGTLLHQFSGVDRLQLVAEIESLLWRITLGQL